MKILMSSHFFVPLVGGLVTVSEILANEFVRQGHKVILITQNPVPGPDNFRFQVIPQPGPSQLLNLVRWCDVFFHNNISLRVAWPLLCIRRPWVVAHHIWLPSEGGIKRLNGRIKRNAIRYVRNIAVSKAMADHIGASSEVISNPYDPAKFHVIREIPKDKELLFLGRLISDKGLALLLKALSRLKTKGLTPALTVIGSGPDEEVSRVLVRDLGLEAQVRFAGEKQGRVLTEALNAHKILVVPSLWNEPFGIVALEGIACGCVVVGSDGGGLADAIGQCGVTFPNGDVDALAACLSELLRHPEHAERHRAAAPAHLARHHPSDVAKRYLAVFADATKRVQS